MTESGKHWVLALTAGIGAGIAAYIGHGALLTLHATDIFAASMLAVPLYIIGGAAAAGATTALIPARATPATWSSAGPILWNAAALAVLVAVLAGRSPSLWVAIAACAAGAAFLLKVRDRQSARHQPVSAQP